jgi:succinate-semialdehyde dehydrogenase/glutarate-semialdehyde dehydrogenase
MYADLKMLLDGEWTNGANGRREPVIDPATEQTLGELPLAEREDLDRALDAARRNQKPWAATPPAERGRILRKAAEIMRAKADEIARQVTREEGKVLAEARAETLIGADIIEWYAEEGRRTYGRIVPGANPDVRFLVIKEPVGPVAAFTPWNFPVVTPARKIGGALAAGCTLIIKPSEETPAGALAIARALEEAGLPRGVLNLVFGVPAEVSEHVIASDVIKKISFTGSIPVGKHLAKLAAEGMKRATMELGGHAPVIVFDDVNVEKAATMSVAGKYRNAGQVCISPTRFFVHDKVYKSFVTAFAEKAAALKVGNGLEDGVQMGPLANDRRLEAVDGFVKEAVECGAELKTGGQRIGNQGYFYAPTVLAEVPEEARVMNDEPFGPIAPIVRFTDFDDLVERANRLPYGLASYAFTSSTETATRISNALQAGMVGVNHFVISTPETPFGGVKESGYGSEGGVEGLEAYLATKLVSQAPNV